MSRLVALAVFGLSGCQLLIGLEPRSYVDGGSGCQVAADCQSPDASMVCVPTTGACVPLLDDNCRERFGADPQEDTVVLASLLAMQGSQAATNQARLEAVKMAVSEINRFGGIPRKDGRKPITLLICDATTLVPAGRHLADLQVSAIIGPNLSQDVVTLTNEVTRAAQLVSITPAALAGSIASLEDDDYTWRVIPSDVQRSPLLVRRINELEDALRDGGVPRVRFALLARNDVFGAGTATALNQTLRINDAGLSDLANAAWVQVKLYDPTRPEQAAVVADLAAFKPDIVVGAGTAEVVTQIIAPLEATLDGGTRRPQYVVIDSAKTTDLLTFVGDAGVRWGVRERVSGTGFGPAPEAMQNFSDFVFNYRAFTGKSFPNVAGMGPAYDSVYLVATALASQRDAVENGRTVLRGLRLLAPGGQRFNTGAQSVQSLFSAAELGTSISLLGTHGPLEFDSSGDVLGSQVETWCISRDQATGAVAYAPAGLTFNTKSGAFAGSYTPCP